MTPAPKWTRFGRWSPDGQRCYALLDHKQARGGCERQIYGPTEYAHFDETADQALRRMWGSWA